MPLNIIRNDITRVQADAIVNTANLDPAVGEGVDSAIYSAAGFDDLLAERKRIGRIEPGDARATSAYKLPAKHIIHTVGPVWRGGNAGEKETLASCYRTSLLLAEKLGDESVAFPLISTGTFGFPKDLALSTAISEIGSFLTSHDMNVILVVYNKEAFVLSGKIFSDVRSYIDEQDVIVRDLPESYTSGRVRNLSELDRYESNPYERVRNLSDPNSSERASNEQSGNATSQSRAYGSAPVSRSPQFDREIRNITRPEETAEYFDGSAPDTVGRIPNPEKTAPCPEEPALDFDMLPEMGAAGPEMDTEELDDIIRKRGATFQQTLFHIIDKKHLDDLEVYKKANLDRKLFSKIRSNVNYSPSKKTVLALAIGMELNLDETVDLMRSAGLAFTPASKFDLIIEYCISHNFYDILEINCMLFDNDEPTLGM